MNGKDILIVEDETIVALDMKMRLESLGYRVVGVVDTGALALEFLQRAKPDLVLMDIKLKGNIDGIETARKARERVEVPIIFVTAFTDESTLERAKHASPYGYIVKPFHERELRIAIELALYKFQYELSMRRQVQIAEEANRLKGDFLANVSHELKTPLNSVIGFTELSIDRSVDDEQREYLSTVLQSARSLVTLIDSILDFARLEKSGMAPEYAAFPLEELLGECVDFLSIGAQAKGLEASFRMARDLPRSIVGDRGRVRQILMNLLDNAVKFTDRGRVRIEASRLPSSALPLPPADSPFSPEGGEPRAFSLRLVVEDSGMGMAEDLISKAFESFTQLDGSRSRPAGGTGLGLAIVSRSVSLLAGSLAVKSAPGAGTRFEILLPAWEPAGSPVPLGLPGTLFILAGFSAEEREDIEEALASLGAASTLASGLEEAAGKPMGFVLASDREASAGKSRIARLSGRLIVACRPGFIGKSELVSAGCAILPYPLRAGSLAEAVLRLSGKGGSAATPSGTDLPRVGGPGPGFWETLGGRSADGSPGSPALAAGGADLGSFATAVESAIGAGDLSLAERECKRFHGLFQASGDERSERLAFTALLLARKGDGDGLAEAMRKARTEAVPGPRSKGEEG